ncbi:nucleotidyltransferase [Clostridium sp. JS66]|uniref:nucleotidyltransferase n=1 Tax=Clostridium sp. JS66 TaxID=3064705 RepID=UPI00298D8FFD|nr:nucleotidyltransferase [Clostridium sp. JS66]WPC40721.1 nucleotidyltransferase [Clostridium sp. JS66]
MKVTGIIVEYNPFHNGHLHHIKKSKSLTNCDAIVAVMSGNFVQRGLPAIVDKWTRAKMALMNGVDLVIELPLVYSVSSAEFFAGGSISLLNNLGVVNNICFGSECGDIETLLYISKILSEEPINFKKFLKDELNEGFSYPLARSKALLKFLKVNNSKSLHFENIEEILNSSNNILGLEYCKKLVKLNSNILPFTIKREGGHYNSTVFNEQFSSASSIRKYMKDNKDIDILTNYIPDNVYNLLLNLNRNNYHFTFEDEIFPYIKYKYTLYKNSITKLPDVSEGIENRIFKALENTENFNELISDSKTKRYTYTRINRILCQFFLGLENWDTVTLRKESCPYARILGFNSTGSKILKAIKENSTIPIYTKLPKNPIPTLGLDIHATRVYSLLNKSINPNSDYLTSPIIIK